MVIRQARPPRPPLRRNWLLLALWLPALTDSASAAQFLSFRAVRGPAGTDVVAGGHVIMRLRPGMRINGGAAALAAELNRLAFTGLAPAEISVRSTSTATQIVAAGKTLVTLDEQSARLAGTTPSALAADWAGNLKDLLAIPYVVLEPFGRLQVPLGETRRCRWGGTAGVDLSFTTAAPEIAAVALSEDGRALIVQGVGVGTTMLTASLDGAKAQLPVEVKAWATRVARAVVAEVTAPPLPADDLRRTLRNAVLFGARPAPGATIELGEPRPSNGRYLVPLRASGEGCLAVSEEVAVTLKTIPLSLPPVQELLISNLPEKITEPATLLRERLLGQSPVRLLWHHVNFGGRPLRFVARLVNRGDKAARVHVTESATGPLRDEIYVGHQAMMRFVQLIEQGEGYVLNIPPGRMLDLYDVRLPVRGIVSGLARVVPLEAGDLLLEVVAEDAWPMDAYFAPVPDRLRHDPPLTPYRFEAEKKVVLAYEAGGPWAFFHLGKHYSVNLQGQKLYGDYGVGYTIVMTCKNPTAAAVRCVLSLRAGGGVARASYYLDGQLTETGLLRATKEEIIQRFDLAPAAERKFTMRIIPESGSNYPITLTIRDL